MLFYLASYAVTNLGGLRRHRAARLARERRTTSCATIAGLWHARTRRWPPLLTVFLLSLGGFPPTAGFIAKWYIFSAAVSEGYYGLAIIGVLTSVVSVFFYLRIVVMMYMTERDARRRAAPGAEPGDGGAGRLDARRLLPRRAAGTGHRLGGAVDRDDFLSVGNGTGTGGTGSGAVRTTARA